MTMDVKDRRKALFTFRFHQLEPHRKIFYDPWFRFRRSRQGRFDVVSKSHPNPVPVNFGKDWPVSIMDPIVDTIEDARCKVYDCRPSEIENITYQVCMNGKEVLTFNRKEAKNGHPTVMYLLDRINWWEENLWEDKVVFEVTIAGLPTTYDRLNDLWSSSDQGKCTRTDYLFLDSFAIFSKLMLFPKQYC